MTIDQEMELLGNIKNKHDEKKAYQIIWKECKRKLPEMCKRLEKEREEMFEKLLDKNLIEKKLYLLQKIGEGKDEYHAAKSNS